MLGILCLKRFSWFAKIQLYVMFGCMFLFIYIGDTNLFYYALPFTVFAAVGFGILGKVIDKISKQKNKLCIWGMSVVLLVSVSGAYFTSTHVWFMHKEQEDLYLYKMKEIIEREENPTLLNYNSIDAGLYTVTGIIPTCRYFHRPNVALDEMIQVQEQFVAEGKTMFVLAKNTYSPTIEENYRLVVQETHEHFGDEVIYYLFQLK